MKIIHVIINWTEIYFIKQHQTSCDVLSHKTRFQLIVFFILKKND